MELASGSLKISLGVLLMSHIVHLLNLFLNLIKILIQLKLISFSHLGKVIRLVFLVAISSISVLKFTVLSKS